ncbi:MAG: 2Fe-2S iron-sulfur cluster-binding protein [Candidatus Zixiibacteriota bacterium]
MINIEINGKSYQIEEGQTILQAAKKLGIHIPTLCHYDGLSDYGACRICVVQVGKWLQTACTYPVRDGMTVSTDTERVLRTRKIMIELLLSRCPESKKLKELAAEYGVAKIRPKIKNDNCLLCGICVRMCHERMGRGAISFSGRGHKRKVSPAFEKVSNECQTCGACIDVCPADYIKIETISENDLRPLKSEFEEGLVERHPIYISYPQAVPNTASIDREHCVHLTTGDNCQLCKDSCEADAINFDEKEKIEDIDVGAVIISSGATKHDPSHKYEFGYGRYPNVITSIQFERILSASGPFMGHIQRPSDGKPPRKVAWIQCIGSRDPYDHKFHCSAVCCMYAVKEAMIAKEHEKGLDTTIFYMDLRAYGKDFEKYYNRAKDEMNVRFVRSRVGKVIEIPETGNLMVYYSEEESGRQLAEEYDMVILSVGFNANIANSSYADKLDIRLNRNMFFETGAFTPLNTTRDGIFVCGTAQSPKDIPETVMQASGAVSAVERILSEARGSEVSVKTFPPERDVKGQKPRIGVFVCHCGINIASVVDISEVVEYAKTLPNVVYATENLFTCSQDTQAGMQEIIDEYKLNRVVVASCTPRTHEPLFQETLKEAGLNPQLFEMTNIRDQCSWVHRDNPEKATSKSKDLLRMAIAKSRILEPLPIITLDVDQSALVIGGGLAGMVSALSIAESGFPVTLIEREKKLAGNLRKLKFIAVGDEVAPFMDELIKRIKEHENIDIFTNCNIDAVDGYIGNYKTNIKLENGDHKLIEHGVIVVATGAKETKPDEYFYGEDERIITQFELEEKLETIDRKALKKLKEVVMIQCVGSRNENRPYCSRVCCTQSIKNAIRIKKMNPKTDVYILYRDIRTYGFNEDYFSEARDLGVIFIRYKDDEKPLVEKDGDCLLVRLDDPILQATIEIEPDLLVLAAAIEPDKSAPQISRMLKAPLNEDGFFLEAHVKLRPVDFATEGIFLAGLAHSPKKIEETISQAMAAAARAVTAISSDTYTAESIVANVDQEVCVGCGICEDVCPYDAPSVIIKNGKAVSEVNVALCKGCGNCAGSCPSGAMEQLGFKTKQTTAMFEAALKGI